MQKSVILVVSRWPRSHNYFHLIFNSVQVLSLCSSKLWTHYTLLPYFKVRIELKIFSVSQEVRVLFQLMSDQSFKLSLCTISELTGSDPGRLPCLLDPFACDRDFFLLHLEIICSLLFICPLFLPLLKPFLINWFMVRNRCFMQVGPGDIDSWINWHVHWFISLFLLLLLIKELCSRHSKCC